MRKLSMVIVVEALFCGLCLAHQATPAPSSEASKQGQQTSTPPAQSEAQAPADAPRIAPGSVIPVELKTTVDAKKAKTGDEVEARVTQDLKAGNGQLVVAKDTKVVGRITEAQARSKEQHESQVGIAFDHAVTKDGRDLSLPMSIQAIIVPQSVNSRGADTRGAETETPQPPPAGPEPGGMPAGGGRPGAMGMGAPPMPAPSAPTAGGEPAATGGGHQAITANTQGVIGMPDMKLSTPGEDTQGSVVSSEKRNVKLDNGTLMLLKVNQ